MTELERRILAEIERLKLRLQSLWPVTTDRIADGAVTSAKIADGTIVDADVSASAAIAQSKISNAVRAIDADKVDGLHAATSGANAHVVATDASGSATISGAINVGTATGAGTGGIAYSGNLRPYRSSALQTARALVNSGTVSASADLTLTTTATDFLVTTQTFLDGVLVVVAHVVCMCSSFTALTDVNAQLIFDGSNVLDACVVNVLMQWDRKNLTVCFVGSVAAGSHTISVKVNKLQNQNTIVAQTWYSRMIWQHYT